MSISVIGPNKRFSVLIGRYVKGWALIQNLRFVSSRGLAASLDNLKDFYAEGFNKFLSDPDIRNALAGVKDDAKLIVNQVTSHSREQAELSIDATSVIFAHSVLDALLFDLLSFSGKYHPDSWFRYIKKKEVKYTYRELLQKNKVEITQDVVEKNLRALRYSMIEKCKCLHVICKLDCNWKSMTYYVYEETQLEELDNLRHNIVHGLVFDLTITAVEQKLKYLENTGWHFILMMKETYDLKPDSRVVYGLLQNKIAELKDFI
jgi:hypothetical protein